MLANELLLLPHVHRDGRPARLDSREAMLKGGSRGSAVVPGEPDKSLLVEAIRQTNEKLKMPMGGKLKDSEIEDLVAWIKAGATWPTAPAANPVSKNGDKYVIPAERKSFWSLVPLAEPKAPVVKDPKWAKSNIDRFVLARLEKEGMKPMRAASRHDLIRRASLDLDRTAADGGRNCGIREGFIA